MQAYIHTYIHAHKHTYIHTYVYTYIHTLRIKEIEGQLRDFDIISSDFTVQIYEFTKKIIIKIYNLIVNDISLFFVVQSRGGGEARRGGEAGGRGGGERRLSLGKALSISAHETVPGVYVCVCVCVRAHACAHTYIHTHTLTHTHTHRVADKPRLPKAQAKKRNHQKFPDTAWT